MGLSRLSAKCRACPKVDICDHKEMEALGYLPTPKKESCSTIGDLIVEASSITVNGVPVAKIADNFKSLINSLAYLKGYH